METPDRSKKRRNDVDDTSTTSRSSWVVPAFPSSPSPKRKYAARPKPPSKLAPPLGFTNNFNTTQKPLKRLSHDPRHLFTPQASTSNTSPKKQSTAPSFKPLNLNPKFKESTSPKRVSSTSDPRNPQPLPARSLANKGWPASPSHSSLKPLKQVPSTTRLALFSTPRKLEDDTMDIDAGMGQVAMRNLNSPDAFASFLTPHDKPPKEVSARDSEISRGMDFSPEKGDRNWKGKSKFVKNGLAERATMLISRAQNDLSLWSHDISRSISIPSSLTKPHSSNRPSSNIPDLRLVVKKILLDWKTREAVLEALNAETMSFSSRLLGAPYALARCEVLRRAGSSSVKGKERAGTEHPSQKPDAIEQLVLFSFSTASSSSAAAARVSSVVGFGEGKEVMVWKPWIDIELPSGENETGAFVEVAVVDPPDHAAAEGGEPSTMPNHEDILSFGDELPVGKGGSSANVTTHRALLCSRFVVVR